MKFSVGIPAYKGKYLKECVESILSQVYADFELIIVNDASPENLDKIICGFTDKRIRYYKNERNFGAVNVVDNWNKCLSYAVGEYFVLMGDDDTMEPNYLEEFANLIEKYPDCGVYHCRVKIIDDQSDFISLTETRPDFESVYENIWYRISGKRVQFISDFVYRRELLVKNGGFYKLPLAWASDDISAYIASRDGGIANTNKPVFNYRKNAQTISSTGRLQLKLDAIREEEAWIKAFLQQSIPVNVIDSYLHQMIIGHLNNYNSKKIVYTLSSNFRNVRLIKIGYWIKILKQYNISLSVFVYAIIIFLKDKREKKFI